jgi:dihydropteroate synthase
VPHLPDGASPAHAQIREFGGRPHDFARRVAVVAVVDITPNSFHRPGSTFALDDAVAAIRQAADEQADWLDIGGVAYAPGPDVSVREELDRVLPAVAATRKHTDLVISIDTTSPEVARRAIAEGADVINDASGLRDPELAEVVAETGAGLILTHSGDGPGTTSFRVTYDDVTAEVIDYLQSQVELALARGVRPEQIIVDPGIDLHKNTHHSLQLMRRLNEIVDLGYPLMAALSRKDFIGESLGGLPSEERLEGSLAATTFSIWQGARLVRAHDVRATVRTARMTEVLLGLQPPETALHNLV